MKARIIINSAIPKALNEKESTEAVPIKQPTIAEAAEPIEAGLTARVCALSSPPSSTELTV